ncbi:glycosyltransferase family 2 protein [Methanolacinia paynteri]|uniref:glycosyltransferase family 2 protein n=1 Tax=Methanolacinia paynteri TaxID=230356 RepID=UPI00064EFF2E|nr:glycosyltransferase family 2 protein [Methanolacinia paynteri]
MNENTAPKSINNRPYISVILPALNEELTIADCIEEIKTVLYENNISAEIIVSSSSTDRTDEIAENLGAKVIRPEKKGYGNAYLFAFKEASGEIVVILDADGTYDIKKIPAFIKEIESGSDFVMGSRLRGNIMKGAMPALHQYIGNPFLTWMLNKVFKTNISDAHCGMRAIKKEALDSLNLKTPGMEFASEMIIEAARKKLKISEVPIDYYPRRAPSNLHSFADGWRHVRFMLLYQPLPFLAIPGFFFFVMGATLMILYFLEGDVENANLHSFVLAAILFIGGLQAILMGINIKTYSVIAGYSERVGIITKIANYQNLERELFAGIIIIVAGVIMGIYIILNWIESGFGSLFQVTNAVIALTLFLSGMQIIFSAVFNSMMLINYDD